MKTCSHAVSTHAVDFETKLETSRGFIGNGEPPPPPVYAPATLDRQGGGLALKEDILADRGSWHTGQSSKSMFSTMTDSHVTVNGRQASIGARLLSTGGLLLENPVFAFFRAERPVWKETRRKN